MTRGKNRSLALAGYYGMKNFGDDLFAYVAVNAAKDFWTREKIVVVSPPLHGLSANYTLTPGFYSDSYNKHSVLGKAVRFVNTIKSAAFNDRYVYCGGSLFSNGATGSRRYVDRIAGTHLSAVGVSIGPFSSSLAERQVKDSLRKIEFLAVRDRRSYEVAKSFSLDGKVTLAADLAGLIHRYMPVDVRKITEPVAKNEPFDGFRIGFSPCNYNGSASSEQLDFCRKFVAAVAKIHAMRKIEVVVICVNGHHIVGDAALSEMAVKMLSNEGIPVRLVKHESAGVLGTLHEISSLNCYVSARLHGAITAYMCGVPIVIHQHHLKMVDFADDIGLSEEMRFDENGDLFRSIQNMLDGKISIKKPIDEFSVEAEKNFTAAPWCSDGAP